MKYLSPIIALCALLTTTLVSAELKFTHPKDVKPDRNYILVLQAKSGMKEPGYVPIMEAFIMYEEHRLGSPSYKLEENTDVGDKNEFRWRFPNGPIPTDETDMSSNILSVRDDAYMAPVWDNGAREWVIETTAPKNRVNLITAHAMGDAIVLLKRDTLGPRFLSGSLGASSTEVVKWKLVETTPKWNRR